MSQSAKKSDSAAGLPGVADPQQIVGDVAAHLGVTVSGVTEIKGGTCNRLFRFDLEDGRSVLVKFYYVDERNRLSREFNALTFLRSNGFNDVPEPFYEDAKKGYAVYSFEPGQPKPAKTLTRSDLLQMMDFLVRLHSIDPKEVGVDFPDAVFACFTLQDYVKNIEYRCSRFAAALDSNHLPSLVSQFAIQHDLLRRTALLVQQATKGLARAELERPIEQSRRRLGMVDFGPHNTLFDTYGTARFIDLEYFGWDDPLRDIAGFAEHDQLRALPIEERHFAVDYYRTHVKLPPTFLARLPVILQLVEIEWVSIHMLALTPTKIDLRKFGNPQFDQESYERDQLLKIESRLAGFDGEPL